MTTSTSTPLFCFDALGGACLADPRQSRARAAPARYSVVASRAWQHTDGHQASIYGSLPWCSEAQAADWTMVHRGWTVQCERTGTVGIGRLPWATREEAQAWVEAQAARVAPRDLGALL